MGFAEALVAHDDATLAELRQPIVQALGPEGLRETASIAANFQRMVRIADATGIPQEPPILALGGDLIEELELRKLGSAVNTPETSAAVRLLGRLLRPVGPRVMSGLASLLRRRTAS